MSQCRIGIIGIGILGNAILESLININDKIVADAGKDALNKIQINIKCFDAYKNIGCFDDILDTEILFLCLPTEFDPNNNSFDKNEIYKTCNALSSHGYSGVIVIKSTIEPGTTSELASKYPHLNIIHNPEFLTARTATTDFLNQKHIVIGCSPTISPLKIKIITDFYMKYFGAVICDDENMEILMNSKYKDPVISICSSTESECMKLFCNSFYATKVQFFTEMKLLCDKIGIEYDKVRCLMLLNKWINPMHTQVPGPDGNISFGGKCFPKDTKALNSFLGSNNVANRVLDAVVRENMEMRGGEDEAKS